MKNKKGAEMTIGTIIVIILALVVLVILIYGFSTGWSNLWEKINVFGGGKSNVQTIIQACQLACTTSSDYNYCKTQKLIEDANGDGKMATRSVNCENLANEPKYGLAKCEAIEKCKVVSSNEAECEIITDSVLCGDKAGCKWDGSCIAK